MSVIVSLQDVVNEMAEISDNHAAFLDRRTGELLTLNEHHRQLLEVATDEQLSDWQRELREALRAGEVLELPGTYEQKLYSIVEQFCHSVRDAGHKSRLLDAIRGPRAFRDFKRAIYDLGIGEKWIGFRNRAFEEIAAAWLERHGVAYDRAA